MAVVGSARGETLAEGGIVGAVCVCGDQFAQALPETRAQRSARRRHMRRRKETVWRARERTEKWFMLLSALISSQH